MGLKYELQSITAEAVTNVEAALTQRLDSVSPAELKNEALASINNYPALNQLAVLVSQQALEEGCAIEEAFQRGAGASHALLVLTTLAELRELPPL
jgi:hypothetical protein